MPLKLKKLSVQWKIRGLCMQVEVLSKKQTQGV